MAQHFRRYSRGDTVAFFQHVKKITGQPVVTQLSGTAWDAYNWWDLQGHEFRSELVKSNSGSWATDTIELMFIDDIGAQIWDKLYDEYKQQCPRR